MRSTTGSRGSTPGPTTTFTTSFELRELVARGRALARRPTPLPELVRVADHEVDLVAHQVHRAGRPIALTAKKFALLEFFVRHQGTVRPAAGARPPARLRGRDEGGFVAEAQQKVAAAVPLPPGYHMPWGGQFENQRHATRQLAVIVPTSIALIVLLLFSAFGSTKYAAFILAVLPFALVGGVFTLWLRDIHLSVSAAVGFIALFGISVQNGVLLVTATLLTLLLLPVLYVMFHEDPHVDVPR